MNILKRKDLDKFFAIKMKEVPDNDRHDKFMLGPICYCGNSLLIAIGYDPLDGTITIFCRICNESLTQIQVAD